MAVRTTDIALRDLAHDRGPVPSAEHDANVHIFRAFDMVELKQADVARTAVDTRMRSQVFMESPDVVLSALLNLEHCASDVARTISFVVSPTVRGLARPAVPMAFAPAPVPERELVKRLELATGVAPLYHPDFPQQELVDDRQTCC